MREIDLGIQSAGHQPQLTEIEGECLKILQERGMGEDSAISANALSVFLWGTDKAESKRDTRHLINHLIITHETPIICQAGNGGGYYLAGNPQEVDRFYKSFHRRAMTGLLKASRGKKSAFVSIMAQLSLGFDDPESAEAIERLKLSPDSDPVPAWVQITTKLLDRISGDPQRYAAEIRKLQRAYGDIFVPRDKVIMLKAKTAEFQQLLNEIA